MDIKKYSTDYWHRLAVWQETALGPYEKWRRELVKKKIQRNNFLILDMGCGRGSMSEDLTAAHTVIGLDMCEKALKEASAKGVKVVLGDIDGGIPFTDKSFDAILIMDVLEHALDPESLLGECRRVVKDNGILVISVPNMLNIVNRFYFLCGAFKDITDVYHKRDALFSEHIRVFSRNVLEKLVEKTGLVCISRKYYFPQRISEEPWKKLRIIGEGIYYSGLYKILPALFARNFLFVCVKDSRKKEEAG